MTAVGYTAPSLSEIHDTGINTNCFGSQFAVRNILVIFGNGSNDSITQCRILFLDEPTTGIDVASARQIRQLIQTLNQKGTTIFLTTHYIEEAERLCNRIAFIVGGRIVRIGLLDELMREVQQENVVQLAFADGVSDLKSSLQENFPDVVVEVPENQAIRLRSSRPLNLTPLMRFFEERNLPVYEARIMRPSLEEVFVKITGIELQKMKQEKEGKGKQ